MHQWKKYANLYAMYELTGINHAARVLYKDDNNTDADDNDDAIAHTDTKMRTQPNNIS